MTKNVQKIFLKFLECPKMIQKLKKILTVSKTVQKIFKNFKSVQQIKKIFKKFLECPKMIIKF